MLLDVMISVLATVFVVYFVYNEIKTLEEEVDVKNY